jgi:type II secretory pathway component PulF
MTVFVVSFLAESGRRRSVSVWARSEQAALQACRGASGFPLGVRISSWRTLVSRRPRLSSKELVMALDSMELMIASGVRINGVVRVLASRSKSGRVRSLWNEMALLLEETGKLGRALRAFPATFSSELVEIIDAHESAGRLGEGIIVARAHVARVGEIRRECVKAAAYPLVVSMVGAAAGVVLFLYTLPRFAVMMSDLGVAHTHLATRIIFAVSSLVNAHPWGAVMLVVAPFGFLPAASAPQVRPTIDRLLTKTPVVGCAIEALCMARVCATFSALTRSGIRVVEALEQCAKVSGNEVYRTGLRRVIRSVRNNQTVGSGFEEAGVFGPEMVLAIRCSEGSLGVVFDRLAAHYQDEARHRVASALRLLEPLMLVGVLAVVLVVALAVVLPLVEVLNGIH